VGGLSTALYVVLTTGLTRANVALVEASLVSYLVCSVFSFAGHRAFVFASRGFWAVEAVRFAALNSAGLITTAAAPTILTDRFGLAPTYAIVTTCVVAPVANYLAMRSLVFRRARRDALAAQ
jgi:putative flippase GtrA